MQDDITDPLRQLEIHIDILINSLQSHKSDCAIINGTNIIERFINEAQSSILWRKDQTWMQAVLNILELATNDDYFKFQFRGVFTTDGRHLNCMTPVRQLLYKNYVELAIYAGEHKRVQTILPLIFLNQYFLKKNILGPLKEHHEAIEIQSGMINLLLGKR